MFFQRPILQEQLTNGLSGRPVPPSRSTFLFLLTDNDAINQSHGIERKRDMVIQSLVEYLGESREELFHDCQEHDREGQAQHIVKILAVHGAPEEDPSDVPIVIEDTSLSCYVLKRLRSAFLLG
ncbi:hypothetical protein MHYP_G00219540 [Metynnis hypsauchen]